MRQLVEKALFSLFRFWYVIPCRGTIDMLGGEGFVLYEKVWQTQQQAETEISKADI